MQGWGGQLKDDKALTQPHLLPRQGPDLGVGTVAIKSPPPVCEGQPKLQFNVKMAGAIGAHVSL